jgi:hypothetical protein
VFLANANKYSMGRKKLIETDEERRLRLRAAYNRWIANPENKKKKYEADKKYASESHRKWRQANKDKTRLKSANERAVRLQRLPTWADRELIKEFYLNCPEGYHVDHIIPLRGKLVSGLHTIDNLQYLPAKENISKGNKFALAA